MDMKTKTNPHPVSEGYVPSKYNPDHVYVKYVDEPVDWDLLKRTCREILRRATKEDFERCERIMREKKLLTPQQLHECYGDPLPEENNENEEG